MNAWPSSPLRHTARRGAAALSLLLACALPGCGGGGDGAKPAAARYDYPSALDITFGQAGLQVLSTGLPPRAYVGNFSPAAMAVDAAGRIILAGSRTSADRQAWLLRLNPDGTPDLTCGDRGWISWTTGGPAVVMQVRVLRDGRYAVGGNLGLPSIWVITANCTVDSTFGSGGQARFPSVPATEVQGGVVDLAQDTSGAITAIASSTLSGRMAAARWTEAGVVDTAFGQAGLVLVATPDGGSPRPGKLALRPDGRILIAAAAIYSSQVGQLPAFVQLLPDGSPDLAFGDHGFAIGTPTPNTVGLPKALVLLPNGVAVQAGLTQPGVIVGTVIDVDAYWFSVNANGAPNTRYGLGGISTWSAGPPDRVRSTNYATALELDASGNLASCINWTNNTDQDPTPKAAIPQVLVQLRTVDGAPIGFFGASGTASLPRAGDLASSCVALARSSAGRLLALLDYGPAESATGQTMAIAAVNR